MVESKGKLFLSDGSEYKRPVMKIRGIVPDMRVLEDSVLQGEVDGASKREGLARGGEYMKTVAGTGTTVQAEKGLRERMKEEKGRPKRWRCGKVRFKN